MKIIFAILFVLFINLAHSQDTIQQMNGRMLIGTITDTADTDLSINITKRGKLRKRVIDKYDVFSYRMNGQPETVLYQQDSVLGHFLPASEQRFYLYGERDAIHHYNPIGIKVLSCAFSYGVSIYDLYAFDTINKYGKTGFFRGSLGLAPIVSWFVIPAISAFTTVQLSLRKVSNRRYLEHEIYLDGYGYVARRKKVFGSFVFSMGGTLLGLGTHLIVNAVR